jgi:hypothetical protein
VRLNFCECFLTTLDLEQEFEDGLPTLIKMIFEGGEKALGLVNNEAKV